MLRPLNILIIDDHPTIIEGYKSILSLLKDKYEFSFSEAHNCEKAYEKITSEGGFDVVLVDIILPPFEQKKLFSGEDLAILFKKLLPACKTIIITSHTEFITIYSLAKKICPDGLLIKSDFTAEELIIAFEQVINNEIYYSLTAKKSIEQIIGKETYLDAVNRRIIGLLSKGVKTKNLPIHLNLSISAIDKRKSQIKLFFDIAKGTDEDILMAARKKGYI